jgi:hypothetical protein
MVDVHEVPASDDYEKSDARIGPIIKFVVWLGVSAAIVLVAMYLMLEAMKKLPLPNSDRDLHPLALEREAPPVPPRLEMKPGVHKDVEGRLIDENAADKPFTTDMIQSWKKRWNEQLTQYAVIDAQAKIYRVPVDRAMEIALKKGFPSATKPKN